MIHGLRNNARLSISAFQFGFFSRRSHRIVLVYDLGLTLQNRCIIAHVQQGIQLGQARALVVKLLFLQKRLLQFLFGAVQLDAQLL